jgi:hypothetical protein
MQGPSAISSLQGTLKTKPLCGEHLPDSGKKGTHRENLMIFNRCIVRIQEVVGEGRALLSASMRTHYYAFDGALAVKG